MYNLSVLKNFRKSFSIITTKFSFNNYHLIFQVILQKFDINYFSSINVHFSNKKILQNVSSSKRKNINFFIKFAFKTLKKSYLEYNNLNSNYQALPSMLRKFCRTVVKIYKKPVFLI